jgi:hypothetical protein
MKYTTRAVNSFRKAEKIDNREEEKNQAPAVLELLDGCHARRRTGF